MGRPQKRSQLVDRSWTWFLLAWSVLAHSRTDKSLTPLNYGGFTVRVHE